MAYQCKVVRRVEFWETDMVGIVHYSNFFRYMEAAEHEFFRLLGLSIVTRPIDPPLGWPRVHAQCDYRRPLRFEDEVEIKLLVSRKKSKSLSYLFRIRKLNTSPPVDVAWGSLTVVCVSHQGGEMKATKIPKEIADRIKVAPARELRAANAPNRRVA